MTRFIKVTYILFLGALSTTCNCPDCTIAGPNILFTANFNLDVVGGLPSPTSIYGPPRSALILEGNAIVVSGTSAGNNYLRLKRQNSVTKLTAVFGDTDNVKACDEFFVEVKLKGEVIPEYYISSAYFSIEALNGSKIASLYLFNNKYHYYDEASVQLSAIEAPYDLMQDHTLRIVVDPSQEKYTVCINGVGLLCRSYDGSDFDIRSSFSITLPTTVLEAFEHTLLIDEVRVIQ